MQQAKADVTAIISADVVHASVGCVELLVQAKADAEDMNVNGSAAAALF